MSLNMNNQYMFQVNQCHDQVPSLQKKPVGVFWDIENCAIPRGLNTYDLVRKIRGIFAQFHLIEREFVVVCDVYGIPHNVINELNEMQVDIVHVCSYSKNASDEKLKQLIYRYVMVQGEFCSVILLSSDINFAPMLSDIRNRIGASVILFHHRQVSPALIATAHHNIDFDYFCSQIPIAAPLYEADNIATYLIISNWPNTFTEEAARNFLNRITGNCGGRVLQIDFLKCEANVIFKCKSDAQRCFQRVNNRRIHGNTLRARFNPILSIQPAPVQLVPTLPASHPLAPLNANANLKMIELASSSPQKALQQVDPEPMNEPELMETAVQRTSSLLLNKLKANRCAMCTHESDKVSRYSNHLFQQQIFAVNISLSELSEKMGKLLEKHNGQMPLNSLPNCWLAEFNQELDTTTEPKVMLEHLLACLPNVTLQYSDVGIKGELISVKFIVKKSTVIERKKKKKVGRKRKAELKKLNILFERIYSLVVSNLATSITTFPSLLLSTLSEKYEEEFSEPLNVEAFGVTSLVELIALLKEDLNLYTFDDDFLVALNLCHQIRCFAKDIQKAMGSNGQTSLDTDVGVDELLNAFKEYFKTDLKIDVYGVCFIDDLIDGIKGKEIVKIPEVTLIPPAEGHKEDKKMINSERCISIIRTLLQSLPNWSIEMTLLYTNYKALLQSEASLPEECSYDEFVQLFSLLDASDYFAVESYGNEQLLVLSRKLRHCELLKRLVQSFYLLGLVSGQHDNSCHCTLSIPIEEIFAHYRLHFNAQNYRCDLHGTTSLTKVFEQALTLLYRRAPTTYPPMSSLFLVYTPQDTLLRNCDPQWIDKTVQLLFAILFQSSSYSLTWQHLCESFTGKRGYRLGPSFLSHGQFRNVFSFEKNDNGNTFYIKLRPVYELAAMCLTVMLLHVDALDGVQLKDDCTRKWNIDQLETEYYDHFGIAIPLPATFDSANYKQLFQQMDLLFNISDAPSGQIQVSLRCADLLELINTESIPTCNYCEKNSTLEENGAHLDGGAISSDLGPLEDNEKNPSANDWL